MLTFKLSRVAVVCFLNKETRKIHKGPILPVALARRVTVQADSTNYHHWFESELEFEDAVWILNSFGYHFDESSLTEDIDHALVLLEDQIYLGVQP
jgi:hypothetical protein